MELDIQTLVFIAGLMHIIQLFVLLHQYIINKTIQGIGWWLLWSGAEVCAFMFMLLRVIPSLKLTAILLQNCFLLMGVMFFYVGIMRFLGRKENMRFLVAFYTALSSVLIYFLYGDDNYSARGVVVCAALAGIAFLSGYALLVNKQRSIAVSANFLGTVFILHGSIFTCRTVIILAYAPTKNFFAPSMLNMITFVDAIIIGILWTFGAIMMINQRLSAEMKDAMAKIKTLSGMLPICASCKSIRDDNGYWRKLEAYMSEHSEVLFSHGL